MSDLAKLGFSVDTTGLKKGEKALDSFASKGEKTEKRTDKSSKKIKDDYEAVEKAVGKTAAEVVRAERKMAKAQKESEKAMAKRGRGIGQTSIQFQQFIGQVQGGQSVMVAFSQQAADIGIVLDRALLGSILGITASIVGMLFAFGSSDAAMIKSGEIIDSLVDDYGKLSGAQQELTKSLLSSEIERQSKSLQALKKDALGVGVGFDGLLSSEKAIKEEKDSFTASILKQELALQKLKSQLKGVVEEQGSFNNVWEEGTVRGGEFLTNLTHTANMAGKTAREMDLYKASILGASEAQLVAINIQHDRIDAFNKEAAAQKALQEGALEFGRMIAAETKAFDAEQKKEKADSIRDFEKLTKSVENFGGTWSKTGEVIVNTFGSIADAMNDYMSQLAEVEKNEKALAVFRASKGEDNLEVIALQNKLESDRVNAELSGMKAISKAGESLFSEKTTAAKTFALLSKAIAVAEIAMSFQKMAAGTVETGVHVANETTKQGANALTAITGAFAAGFPVGFVAGAAMIAIMASLLGGSSSSAGSKDMTEERQSGGFDKATQEIIFAQGAGTVLGSEEKSQSILESQERFEDIQIDQLSELRGIRTSLNNVASGIALVTRNLVASGGLGEFQGDLSGSKFSEEGIGRIFGTNLPLNQISGLGGKLIDSLFGTVKKEVSDSGIQFIASNLGDILEGGIVDAQQFFDVTRTKKKLFGLSKKVTTSTQLEDLDSDFGKQIGAIFQSIGSVISDSALLLGFDVEEALNAFQIDLGTISLEGLSGEEIEAELQAVFSQQADLIAGAAIPSLEEFQKVGEGLFDTLTRVTQEQVIFNDNIDKLGMNLSSLSSVMQIEVAQSVIDLIGGLENFADLTNSFVDDFFTDAEKFTMLENSVSEAFESLGLSMVNSNAEFRALVEGVDLTTESGRELFAALLEISPAFSEFTEGLDDAVMALRDSATDAFSILEKAVDLERKRARAVLDVASDAHRKELDRIKELKDALPSLDPSGFSSAADLAVQTALNQNQLSKLDMLEVSANDVFSLHEQGYQDELERLDAIVADNEALLNAALGIDTSVLSVADAVINLNKTILLLSGETIPSAPLLANSSDGRDSSVKQEEIKEELKKTREDNVRFQLELIKNTKATANLLQRIEIDGLDTRSID